MGVVIVSDFTDVAVSVGKVSRKLLYAAIEENKEILNQVFKYSPDSSCSLDLDTLPSEVGIFLEVYLHVFKNQRIPVETLSVTQISISTYRHICMKHFRVVYYLTPVKLDKVCADARDETVKFLEDLQTTTELIDIVSKLVDTEISWVRKVNEFRRNTVIEAIMGEVKYTFKGMLDLAFPFKTDDDDTTDKAEFNLMRFYEDADISLEVKKLKSNAMETFRVEVPFEEEFTALTELQRQLDTDLMGIGNEVQELNRKHRRIASLQMNSMVFSCTSNFQKAINKFLGNETVLEVDKMCQLYEDLREEFLPRFYDPSNGIEIGSPEHRVRMWNFYAQQVYYQIRHSIIVHQEKEMNQVRQCQDKVTECVKTCMDTVTDHLISCGINDDIRALSGNFLKEMDSFLKNSVLDRIKDKYKRILGRCHEIKYYTNNQENFLKMEIVSKLEKHYSKIFLDKIGDMDKRTITPEMFTSFQTEAQDEVISTLPLYVFNKNLGQEIVKAFTNSCKHRAQNLDSTVIASLIIKPVPFQVVSGSDTTGTDADMQIDNHRLTKTFPFQFHEPSHHYQCITAMPEYENKSFEEIRLNDFKCFRNLGSPQAAAPKEAFQQDLVSFVESFNKPSIVQVNCKTKLFPELKRIERPQEESTPFTFSAGPSSLESPSFTPKAHSTRQEC